MLDVGCSSGRDATYFASLGYQVTAIDASVNLIEGAKEHCSSNKIDWCALSFKDVKSQPWQGRFTRIWACASLLHVPFSELAAAIELLLDTLTEDGVLYASFKYGEGERIESERFFCDMNEARWTTIVSETHHVIDCDIWLSEDRRPEHKGRWFNVIFKKNN
ncbi:class I SAM-dependent methyltransferase [Psychrobacter sp. LV10R520-6]|uniref:class I SAM-dependent methyltransferase n=1 Tax=Psychrobacter sp. LV10R520-6 TaxID=1415574 RepID=UPI002AA0B54B|nr:class I SAM-dependent methyltransferase [Psychrobacter sp. LV10R520-6]